MSVVIHPSRVTGSVQVPPSKSHTMRAILLASLAKGHSQLHGILLSPDTCAMIEACRVLGASITSSAQDLDVEGTEGKVHAEGVIDCGNSGQVLRFVSAIGALGKTSFQITGDASIRARRPVEALIDALKQAGATIVAPSNRPPLTIQGPLQPTNIVMEGKDSQPVSAMLIACAFLKEPSRITVMNLGERPWVQLTCSWLERLGAEVTWTEGVERDVFQVKGGWVPTGWEGTIPSDWSSAAFPLMAGLLNGSALRLVGLAPEDPQGDRAIVTLLENMGASFVWEGGDFVVQKADLIGGRVDGNAMIDALPILCAAAPFMEKGLCIENVGIARCKESDRLEAMAEGLRQLGGRVELGSDWIYVYPTGLLGGEVHSHHDHRIAMAFSVAALRAQGPVRIHDVECVEKSYPRFFASLASWGAQIEENSPCSSCF